jgi:hypothetical protein
MERNCRWFNEWADSVVEDITVEEPPRSRLTTALMTLLRLN